VWPQNALLFSRAFSEHHKYLQPFTLGN
jgi:hypothetical protein